MSAPPPPLQQGRIRIALERIRARAAAREAALGGQQPALPAAPDHAVVGARPDLLGARVRAADSGKRLYRYAKKFLELIEEASREFDPARKSA